MHSIVIAVYFSAYLPISSSADVVAYLSNNYKMTIINNDPEFRQDTRQRCIDTFFATM
jgi:hypothetical protein